MAPKVLWSKLFTQSISLLTCSNLAGFPPPDDQLRKFMTYSLDHRAERQRLRGFIYSILTVTRERLERIESELFGELSRNRCRCNSHG